MSSSIYTYQQQESLKKTFSNLHNPKAFTVYGKDKGDIRNPKYPKSKWLGSWTQEKCSDLLTLEEAFKVLQSVDGLSGIALCFYPNCGHGALDYDKCGADLEKATDKQKEVFNLLSDAPSEVSQSGTGLHHFFLANGTSQKDNGHLELYLNWGYVCLTGNFRDSEQVLPVIDDDVIDQIREIIQPSKRPSSVESKVKLVRHHVAPNDVVALLNNCSPDVPYDDWMHICFAFRASYVQDDGYEHFDRFSQGGKTYDVQKTRTLWDSFNPDKSNYTLGTLIYEASKHKGLPESFGAQSKVGISSLNDAGNAERFASKFRDKLLYVAELKEWLYWKDNYWQVDIKGYVKKLAIEVAKSIFIEASQADQQIASKIASWANNSLQKGHIDAMVELAKPYMSVSVDELDKDPMMLGVKNGVIDLRIGVFRPALPSDLITQQCNVFYDPQATAPLWERFILQVSNNDLDLVGYKQQYLGYSLTGMTSEQCFFYYHGWGRNGKSTEIGVMQNIMGTYAKSIPSSVLMVRNNYGSQGPTPEIARLVGARLVTANETEDGARLAEAQVKAMTGQDILTARVLQGAPFDFKPKFKLFISGNHKPVIRGEDDGIWRRIKVIPFNTQIPESEVDMHLFEKLMTEKSGILNWAIKGCLMWQQNKKLLEPKIIKSEVASYRSDQDIMGAWLEERCIFDADKQCSTRDLYSSYSEWVKASGSVPVSETRFSTRLIERGLTKARINQKMTFVGISLARPMN